MTRAPSICGVILAAGTSSRMGRDKALLPWPPPEPGAPAPSGTFIGATIERLQPHCDLVIVVAGKNAATLAPVVYTRAAFMIVNSATELGQFSSLKLALQDVLNRGRDAVFISLVDRPPVSEATIARLHSAFLVGVNEGYWAVVPEFDEQHGHPYVIGREMIELLLRAPLTTTARDVMHANREHILYVPVDDPMVVANVDTPEDYQRLMETAR